MNPNRKLLLATASLTVLSAIAYASSQWNTNAPMNHSNVVSTNNAVSTNHVETKPHATNIQAAGNFHVEAQLDRTGTVLFYIYGTTEKEMLPIPTMEAEAGMEAQAVLVGEDSMTISLKPKPFSTDPKYHSSRFVGRFARRLDQQEVGLNLSVPIEGRTYRLQWRPENLRMGMLRAAHSETVMPQAASMDEAQKLFLTPGGLYTSADIAANDATTAAEKYKGLMAQHNMSPAPGSPICPITETASDKRFKWIVGGKDYLFCCPPCIEEFVKRAKVRPESVNPPDSYVQPASKPNIKKDR